MKIMLFACGEASCPRVTDNTGRLVKRMVVDTELALSDRPVCSTCGTPMGVYDVRDPDPCERVNGQEEDQEDVFRHAAEEERIQARYRSDRLRRYG